MPTTTPKPQVASRDQLIAALKLCLAQLQLYSGQHDTGTRQIIAECNLTLRLAKPTSK